MTRLEELFNLRAAIEAEIRAEHAYQKRRRALVERTTVTLSRGNWKTRAFVVACSHFEVDGDDILNGSRDRQVVRAKHVAMWLMREAGHSYPDIGRELGCDHTTVINAVRRVEADDELLVVAAGLRDALREVAA